MKNSGKQITFYFAFVLLIILRFIDSSTLINLPTSIKYVFVFIISFLFLIKIITDAHTKKEYIIFIVFLLFFLYLYKICRTYYFLLSFLSVFAIKNIDIKKVVKIDIFAKTFFILSHSFIYLINYSFNYFSIKNLIIISKKGLSHSLYLKNPNVVGAIIIWLILDIFYLISIKRKIKPRDLLIGGIFLIISYTICKSRTPVYIYLLFVVLVFIKNKRVLYFLSKYSYFIMAGISFILIVYPNINNKLFIEINNLFSNRLMYSILAYNKYGLSILPNVLANDYVETLIIDNFYVRCFINYGLVMLLFTGFINLFIPKDNYDIEKKLFILSSVYLFFEAITVNTAFAIPLLLIGDVIFNKERRIKNEKKKSF